MANPTHVKLAATALKLIAKNGRTVTVRLFDETQSDPSQPWLGAADPRGAGMVTVDVSAVFVDPVSGSKMGIQITNPEILKRTNQIALIGHPETDENLEDYNEILDADGKTYGILETQKLQPGETVMLYIMMLAR